MKRYFQKGRILVTGGAGFLGSHLCEKLIERGNVVICLDNFFSGSRSNVAHLTSHPDFEVIRHDVVDPIRLEVDQIFNLACPASPVHYQHNPIKTLQTNVWGAHNMLELALQTGARILQASTSEIYGDPAVHPQPESYWGHVNPIGVRSCYDEGKRCAETLFFDYHRSKGADIRVVRIFNTYGPRMHPNDGRVVSNFIVQALRGHDLTVFGDGTQTRSFCYVEDLIEAMIAVMDFDCQGAPEPFNIGNPQEHTMLDLAKLVIKLTGSSSQIVFRPLPPDDPRQRQPDISSVGTKIGWKPVIDVESGLRRSIEYFRTIV